MKLRQSEEGGPEEKENHSPKHMKIDWENISLEDLAGYVAEELRKKGIKTILVGGACATIYSRSRYQSYDLDFVTYEDMRKVSQVLKELGFKIKHRYFIHDKCQWFVEFVSPPVAIGDQPIEKFEERKSKHGIIKMLRAADSVKDRLASYFHWNDIEGLEQAIDICLECKINFKEIKQWALQEGFPDKYQNFIKLLQKKRRLS